MIFASKLPERESNLSYTARVDSFPSALSTRPMLLPQKIKGSALLNKILAMFSVFWKSYLVFHVPSNTSSTFLFVLVQSRRKSV